MKRYSTIIKILFFLLGLLAADRLIYYVCLYAFERVTIEESGGNIEEAIRHRADIIVLGSSRARHHYDPGVLEQQLGSTVYNLGRDGQGIAYMRGAFDVLLQNYSPRVVIIDITPLFISSDYYQSRLRRASVLAPYLDKSGVVRQIIYGFSGYERIKYLSRAYRFNDMPLRYLRNAFAARNTEANHKGFDPLHKVFVPDKVQKQKDEDYTLDPEPVAHLQCLIREAKKGGITVLLAETPRWFPSLRRPQGEMQLEKVLRKVAEENGVPYVQILQENHPEFRDVSLFGDPSHLNDRGAKLFSRIFSECLSNETRITLSLKR